MEGVVIKRLIDLDLVKYPMDELGLLEEMLRNYERLNF